MFAASFAACVPPCMASATSACARAGASLAPSPVMATKCPAFWKARMAASFDSGVDSAMKSSTPASEAIAAAVRRLSPVIITVCTPMRRSFAKRPAMSGFTTSLSSMIPRTFSSTAMTSGVEPREAMASTCP